MNADKIRVLIADDHPVYRDGLAHLLARNTDIEVVSAAANGREAIALVEQHSPDVVIMDLRMPVLDGVEATRRITATHPTIGVVVLSMFEDDDLVFAAVRAGARGYLLKDADDEQIGAAVRSIARGEAIFGPATARRLLNLVGRAGAPAAPRSHFPQLTARERDVLELMARGRRNNEIAAELYLGERTVRNYVSNVFAKLHVADRAQAITVARDAGLGHPGS